MSEIAGSVFEGCQRFVSVTLPKTLKKTGDKAFYKCEHLLDVTLPNGLEKIGQKCFCGCYRLRKIEIPNSVLDIEPFAFCNTGLSDLKLGNGIPAITYGCFQGTYLKSVDTPESVLELEDDAFHKCSRLENINIPDSVLFIGPRVFQYCKSLRSIHLPKKLVEICPDTFEGCENLRIIADDCENFMVEDGILWNKDKTEKIFELPK